MNAITIEQACDPSNWRWKRGDFRLDGRVFWIYNKQAKNGEYWVSWETMIKWNNRDKQWRLLNKNKQTEAAREWSKRNPDKIASIRCRLKQKKYWIKYQNVRIKSDSMFALKTRVRSRINDFIKKGGYSKPSKTQDMLGCDWAYLKTYLESQFTEGMSWDNRNLWHIDHITPLASAKSIEDVVKLCHYTNLQPLWAADNLSKGAKISR